MRLTTEQRTRFETEGYLAVQGVFPPEDLDPLIADFEDLVGAIARDLVARGRIREEHADLPFERRLAALTWAARESLQRRVSFPANHRRAIFDCLSNPRLVDLVEDVVGPEISCHPTLHVCPKLPAFIGVRYRDFSFESPVHQDAAALQPEADGTRVVTSWIPLVDVTEDMGPVDVYPGLHRGDILRHTSADGGGLTIVEDVRPPGPPVPVPLAKGSVLLLDGRTPHGSRPNNTQIVRWSLDLRWHDARKPSGRPLPGIVVRSREKPLTSYADWLRDWAAVRPDRVPRVMDRWQQDERGEAMC